MKILNSKTVIGATCFSFAVAFFLYALINQQDQKLKDQLAISQLHRIQQLAQQVSNDNKQSENVRNRIEQNLATSIDNQQILLAYLKKQNVNTQALLNYLNGAHINIPSQFNNVAPVPNLNNVQTNPPKSNTNQKQVKRSSKKKVNSPQCLTISQLIPTLPPAQCLPTIAPIMPKQNSKQSQTMPGGLLLPLFPLKINSPAGP
jgi:hypothetical protein